MQNPQDLYVPGSLLRFEVLLDEQVARFQRIHLSAKEELDKICLLQGTVDTLRATGNVVEGDSQKLNEHSARLNTVMLCTGTVLNALNRARLIMASPL
jgi:hypothetical protein